MRVCKISNRLGCVTWLDNFLLNPERLHCPTDVFVRLTGQERYLRGILLAVASADTLQADFADGERDHRAFVWRERKDKGVQSVRFISCLQEVKRLCEVETLAPPQHPTYRGSLNAGLLAASRVKRLAMELAGGDNKSRAYYD